MVALSAAFPGRAQGRAFPTSIYIYIHMWTSTRIWALGKTQPRYHDIVSVPIKSYINIAKKIIFKLRIETIILTKEASQQGTVSN
jgi:hypothetical protein